MQTRLAASVFISILCGLAAAHAAETSSKPEAVESQAQPATVPHAGMVTGVSPTPLSLTGSLQRNAAPDCDGAAPSTGTVTALLSRLVRSSAAARGVQCPIPPVPDHLTIQELHP
mgnify:CR=1 FL=1